MTKSILLPNDDDFTIEFTLNNEKVEADVFDLDIMFSDATSKSKENGTRWFDEFPALFKKKYKLKINKGHSILILNLVSDTISSLKKNVSQQ